MPINFSLRYSDYARFLPAISEMYARYVVNAKPRRVGPIPQDDLDFLNPKSNLFYLPCALYSAGQAAKTEGSTKRKDMVTGRQNPDSIILGDSGGFQIQQGSIKWHGDKTRDRMLNWLEENCDWSMILDFPTGGIDLGTTDQHTQRLRSSGETYTLKDGRKLTLDQFLSEINLDPNDPQECGFGTCLFQTLINNDYFVQKRKPATADRNVVGTQFLNVVQGRNMDESNVWYEWVKHYPFEGWALAGPHKEKFDMTLTRLLDMRRDGLLEKRNWMHILGVGKLANGCAYTTMQRMIRKHDNEKFTISYDVSSPFTTAAFGNIFMGYTLDSSGWIVHCDKLDGRQYLGTLNDRYKRRFGKDIENYAGDEMFLDELRKLWTAMMGSQVELVESITDHDKFIENSRFVETEIGKRLRMRDVCVNTNRALTSTWDVVSYAFMMNHNVQVHLEGVFESQDLYDKGDTDRVPYDMLLLKELIEEILDPATPDPYGVIAKNTKALQCLASDKVTAGRPVLGKAFDAIPINEHKKAIEIFKKKTKSRRLTQPAPNLFDIFE